jgi:glycosyltransferase involved in cell wall biosynthesis
MSTFAIDIRLIGRKRTGDEAVFFNLTRALIALKTRHQFVLLTNIVDTVELDGIKQRLGCTGNELVRIVTLRGKNRFVWNFLTVPWFLFQNHIDVFHTQYILPIAVPSRTKVITHIHDVSFSAYPELIGWKDRLFLSLLIPSALKRADTIAVPSRFTADEIVKYYRIKPEKIIVVPNALSDDFLSVCDDLDAIRRVREQYDLPERFIISVGTLQPRKNIPFLVEACSALRKRIPDMGLVLVGSRTAHHADTAGLDAAITRSHMDTAVFFPGFIPQADLPYVIKAASIYAFPSLYEGFGIPLLEAMSCGVPIAASRIPSLREVGGDAVAYFNPSDLADCAETLYALSIGDEQRTELIRKGYERLNAFSWRKSAVLMLAQYERLSD